MSPGHLPVSLACLSFHPLPSELAADSVQTLPLRRSRPAGPATACPHRSTLPLLSGPVMFIFNFIAYLLPSSLDVMDTVSVESLLFYKSVFAILWAWDGTAQVYIKKAVYKISIRRTSLSLRSNGACKAERKVHTFSRGEGREAGWSAWVFRAPCTTATLTSPTSLSCFRMYTAGSPSTRTTEHAQCTRLCGAHRKDSPSPY